MRQLRGKNAFVTGAGSGIGRAITLALANAGCNLFITDVNEENLSKVADEVRAVNATAKCFSCDLIDPTQIDSLVEQLLVATNSELDILINNAGIAYYGPTHNMTDEQLGRLLQINLHAPIQLVRRLLRTLLDRDEAHIVNLSSMYGFMPGRKLMAYATSKFGLLGFSESLRWEYGRAGIGVTAVCPGFVRSGFFEATQSGYDNGKVPTPPAWLCTTPEKVARRVVRAIRWNSRVVVITPLAHLLGAMRSCCPWVLDLLYGSSRRRKKG
ncbi:MAG: short-subunit dehydrogenase [Pirellulaceae bacterium]|jgi:short-subunit dehydrogenase